jgi:uncharacterized repeat protein (TIGR01451 family)
MAAGGSLTMGPQAMEGNLIVSPGNTLKTGYDLTIPGTHVANSVTFSSPQVAFTGRCVTGGAAVSFTVPMPTQTYSVPANNSNWFPSGDQQSSLVYQGSLAVPDLCGGGKISLANGGTFTAQVLATVAVPGDGIHVRWHYSANGTSGSWSGTSAVQPGTVAADLAVSKSDGLSSAVPGTSTTYTIVVTNVGLATATAQTVTDLLPAVLTSGTWLAVASAGATVAPTSGAGDIHAVVTIAPGASVTFTLGADIDPAATGALSNTASVTVSPGESDTANNSSTDTDTLTPVADFGVTKDDGVTTVTPGGSTTYTVIASNNGPSAATGTVSDPVPPGITGFSWTALPGPGAAVADLSGTGSISDAVSIPPGGTVTFTVIAQIDPSASGSVTNTATVAVSPGVTDPNPANDSASDTDSVAAAGSDLSITKDDGTPVLRLADTTSTTYTIVVTNTGPADAPPEPVTDLRPLNTTSMTWMVTGTTGGATFAIASGSGSMFNSVTVPVGGSVTFMVTVFGVFDDGSQHLVNTATVGVPPGDLTPDDNTATDDDFLIGL